MRINLFKTHQCEKNCSTCHNYVYIIQELEENVLVKCYRFKQEVVFIPKFEYLMKLAVGKEVYEN